MPSQGVAPSGPPHLHRTRASERARGQARPVGRGRRQSITPTAAGRGRRVGCARCWWRRRDPHQGRLSDSRLVAFEGLTTTVQSVATVLCGPVQDQAALSGRLDRIQSLGLEWLGSGSYRQQPTRFPPRPSTTRPIRGLVVYVHPVRLSAVGTAQVRSRIQPGRLSAVWWWLVDCHADCHESRLGSETRLVFALAPCALGEDQPNAHLPEGKSR
jgi:hypothetical protein